MLFPHLSFCVVDVADHVVIYLVFIVNDLGEHNLNLNTVDDLNELKMLAYDRSKWRGMFTFRDYQG